MKVLEIMAKYRGKRSKNRMTGNVTPISSAKGHRVTLMKDTSLVYPELWLEVYIAGDKYEELAFVDMFVRANCKRSLDPLKADLVVFTGGPDVDPQFYGEERHPKTQVDPARDEADIKLYQLCLENGIPMFGVCRGAQFLHVMNGGKLFQDVDNHVGDHFIYDTEERRSVQNASSVHHQLCRPNVTNGMQILATGSKSRERWIDDKQCESGYNQDIEAFFYRDTCCLGVQGHPEYRGYHAFAQWTLQKIHKYISENPDIVLIDNCRRMKPELIAQRDDPNFNERAPMAATVH